MPKCRKMYLCVFFCSQKRQKKKPYHGFFKKLMVLMRKKMFHNLQPSDYKTACQEKQNRKSIGTHCRLRNVKGCGSEQHRVDGSEHHAKDKKDSLGAEPFQCPADQMERKQDTDDNTDSEKADDGKAGKVKV